MTAPARGLAAALALMGAAMAVPAATGWNVRVDDVPAAARRVDAPRRRGHGAVDRARGPRRALRRRPRGAAAVAAAAGGGVRGRARVDALARPRRRRRRDRDDPGDALRVPADRAQGLRRPRAAAGVRQPDPLLVGAASQLARARRRPPAGRAAVLRRPGPRRPRRRPRRRAGRDGAGRDHRRRGARHRPRPRRRGDGPARRAVPGLRSGGGLAGRLGGRDVRRRRGLGSRRPGPGGHPPQRRLVAARRAAARRLRDAVLRPPAARHPGAHRARPGPLMAPAADRRRGGAGGRGRLRGARVLLPRGAARAARPLPGGRRGPAPGERTGPGAPSRRSPSAPGHSRGPASPSS